MAGAERETGKRSLSERSVSDQRVDRVSDLSTPELMKEIVGQVALLGKKQVSMARTELESNLRSEAKVAGGLGAAAVGAIITVTLFLVTAILGLATVMPGWAAGLAVSGFVLLVVAIVAGVSWSRRLRTPLPHTRRELKENVKFTKERWA
jgi:hypothetical protein